MSMFSNVVRWPLATGMRGLELSEEAGGPKLLAWPYVDTLYDYTKLLGPDLTMGTVPPERYDARVVIVGGGVAGLVAAYELLRVGLDPIVLEATDRFGGRVWSRHFTEKDGTPSADFAEMGAMRVPPSNKTFGYYASLFGMEPTPFPDPGQVETLLYYQNTRYPWAAKAPPPGIFNKINDDFNQFVGPLLAAIWAPWQKGDMGAVRDLWQKYIHDYAGVSVYGALRAGIPSWTAEDFNAFGALGVGSGGFGPFYPLGFLELLRTLVNMWENDQKLYVDGMKQLTNGFYTKKVSSPRFGSVSLADRGSVRLRSPVRRVEYDNGHPVVVYSPGGGAEERIDADAVIVATTSYAMSMMGLTIDDGRCNVIEQPVKDTIRNQHLNCSSKMFIRTETKFWKGTNMPMTIQTDELPRGIYFLDYPWTDRGVVLLSYTWADDSVRLVAVPVEQRFQKMRETIAHIAPEVAPHLVPMNGEILNIDWEAEQYYFGAFKLQEPSQEPAMRSANYQFQVALDAANDRGVYLAGDTVSWSGGWTEGALQTGLNAVSAVIQRIGGTPVPGSPLEQNPHLYYYEGGPLIHPPHSTTRLG